MCISKVRIKQFMETVCHAMGHMYEKEMIIYQFYSSNILMKITRTMKITMAMMIMIIWKARYVIIIEKYIKKTVVFIRILLLTGIKSWCYLLVFMTTYKYLWGPFSHNVKKAKIHTTATMISDSFLVRFESGFRQNTYKCNHHSHSSLKLPILI